jgi:hypothetical protein
MVLAALKPDLDRAPGRDIANPIGVAWVGDGDPEESPVGVALLGLMGVLMLVAFGSLVVRSWRSRGDERQQLKWITYASGLLPLAVLAYLLPEVLGTVVFTVPMVFLPAAAGIAILRYRLYDIDRLINRTLVYGLLTALLAGVYAGVVLVLGQVFGGVGRDPPSWAVASATLAVAALFQPARRRIQAVVDRRFNRRKYNAARTVEAFASACAMSSTWTRCRPSCWSWSTRPSSRQGHRWGFAHRAMDFGVLGTLKHEPSGEETGCRLGGMGHLCARRRAYRGGHSR